jgi:glyoxylase-like metal-dependent hydrolase (beta-lactamase superfamily II)
MLVAASIALCAGAALAQQQDFSKVEIKTTKVAGNVYMLEGAGGNIGVSAGPDGLLIVDDQFAPLADKIKAALAAIDKGDLKFLLNTHWHFDHTGGNEIFGMESLIVAHENVRKRLSTEQTIMGRTVPPSPPAALPVITFGETLTIHFNGEAIKATHAPAGHTDGDSIIYFSNSKVVHTGDDFTNGAFPFIDLGVGGSIQGVAKNAERMLKEFPQDTKFIPGHGPLATRADLEKFHRMLVESMATVKAGMDAGKSLEDLQKAGLNAEWKDWGNAFIDTNTWIQLVYESLKSKK